MKIGSLKNMANDPLGAFVDTDIIIRLLTGDDLKKQQAATKLFKKVENGSLSLFAPDTVIADTVFVLSSPRLYNLSRPNIRDLLSVLLRYPNFKVENKQTVITALDLYAESNIDFGDAMLAILVLNTDRKELYSYDHNFDKISNLKRLEP